MVSPRRCESFAIIVPSFHSQKVDSLKLLPKLPKLNLPSSMAMEKVKAKVLNTNDNKISLSMKALEEEMVDTEPAEDLEQYTSKESFGSSLGSLLAGIKLD